MNADKKTADMFLFHLLGMIGCAFGVILAAYSTYLAFVRIPAMKDVFRNFGTELPATTLLVFRMP